MNRAVQRPPNTRQIRPRRYTGDWSYEAVRERLSRRQTGPVTRDASGRSVWLSGASTVIALVLFQLSAAAATVIGTFADATGTPTTYTIRFQPLSTPTLSGSSVITSVAQSTSATDGILGIVLQPGDYEVRVGAKDAFTISVPTTDGTYNISSLITSDITYRYQYAPILESQVATSTHAGRVRLMSDDPGGDPVVYTVGGVDALIYGITNSLVAGSVTTPTAYITTGVAGTLSVTNLTAASVVTPSASAAAGQFGAVTVTNSIVSGSVQTPSASAAALLTGSATVTNAVRAGSVSSPLTTVVAGQFGDVTVTNAISASSGTIATLSSTAATATSASVRDLSLGNALPISQGGTGHRTQLLSRSALAARAADSADIDGSVIHYTVNTLTPARLESGEWNVTGSDMPATYLDGVWVLNPYLVDYDPYFGQRDCVVLPPTGCTSITFTATVSLLPGDASAVPRIAVTDRNISTTIAEDSDTLTALAPTATLTCTASVTAGTEYMVFIQAQAPGITGGPYRFRVHSFSVVPNGATGVFASDFVRVDLQRPMNSPVTERIYGHSYSGYNGSPVEIYDDCLPECGPLSGWRGVLSGTTNVVIEYSGLPESMNYYRIGIVTNDTAAVMHAPSSTNMSHWVADLDGSSNLVQIVGSAQVRGTPGTGINGNRIRAFYVPASAQIEPKPSSVLTVLGDSISCGYAAGYPINNGWVARIRRDAHGGVNLYGYGGQYLMEACVTNASAVVSDLVSAKAHLYWIALGANEYSFASATPTQCYNALTNFLTRLISTDPQAIVWVASPTIQNPATANGLGYTLAQYQTAIYNAAVYVESLWPLQVIAVDGNSLLSVGNLADNVHPGSAGHLEMYTAIKSILEARRDYTDLVSASGDPTKLTRTLASIAAGGTGATNTVEAAANLRVPYMVSTVADLAALGTNAPSTVTVLGARGGNFERFAASTYTADSGTVFDGVGCQWVREGRGVAPLQPLWFAATVTEGLRLALASVEAGYLPKHIVIPEGRYDLYRENDLVYTTTTTRALLRFGAAAFDGLIIEGAGQAATVLYCSKNYYGAYSLSSFFKAASNINQAAGTLAPAFEFRNLTLDTATEDIAYEVRTSVVSATPNNITIATFNAGNSYTDHEGTVRTAATGNRLLLYGQTAAAENGVYVVGATEGTTARATDFDEDSEWAASWRLADTLGTRAFYWTRPAEFTLNATDADIKQTPMRLAVSHGEDSDGVNIPSYVRFTGVTFTNCVFHYLSIYRTKEATFKDCISYGDLPDRAEQVEGFFLNTTDAPILFADCVFRDSHRQKHIYAATYASFTMTGCRAINNAVVVSTRKGHTIISDCQFEGGENSATTGIESQIGLDSTTGVRGGITIVNNHFKDIRGVQAILLNNSTDFIVSGNTYQTDATYVPANSTLLRLYNNTSNGRVDNNQISLGGVPYSTCYKGRLINLEAAGNTNIFASGNITRGVSQFVRFSITPSTSQLVLDGPNYAYWVAYDGWFENGSTVRSANHKNVIPLQTGFLYGTDEYGTEVRAALPAIGSVLTPERLTNAIPPGTFGASLVNLRENQGESMWRAVTATNWVVPTNNWTCISPGAVLHWSGNSLALTASNVNSATSITMRFLTNAVPGQEYTIEGFAIANEVCNLTTSTAWTNTIWQCPQYLDTTMRPFKVTFITSTTNGVLLGRDGRNTLSDILTVSNVTLSTGRYFGTPDGIRIHPSPRNAGLAWHKAQLQTTYGVKTVGAVTDWIRPEADLVVLVPDSDYVLTSVPQVLPGAWIGQVIRLTGANASSVTITDFGTHAGSGWKSLVSTNTVVTTNVVKTALWNGANWIEF